MEISDEFESLPRDESRLMKQHIDKANALQQLIEGKVTEMFASKLGKSVKVKV